MKLVEIDKVSEERDNGAYTAPEPSLAQAFVDHQRYLKAYLKRRLAPDQDPEDFTQEVYLRALNFARRENKIGSWRGILTRIAADLLVDGVRRRQARAADLHVSLESVQEQDDGGVTSPERILQGRQTMMNVERTLEALDPGCRRAFILVRFHGYNYAEVASELNISAISVGRLVERASHRLTKAAIQDR